MEKVIVGMSGGVDSSMAAYYLKEAGYEVEGLSLVLFETRGRGEATACCTLESIEGAARTARGIGIPHSIIDVRDEFVERVIDPFIKSYKSGTTPNPCILCNRHIKFPFLLDEALKRGASFIATGHYARVERGDGGVVLKKGADLSKDQSYVLYVIDGNTLARLLLPLGDLRKEKVREKARELNLPAAYRVESQEICFVEDRDYAKFINTLESADKEGPILDERGRTVGTHMGIHRYTVGQRRGIGVRSNVPLYVTRIDARSNTVHVGPREAALRRAFDVGSLNWLAPKHSSFRAGVKVRSTMKDMPALVEPIGEGRVYVEFDEPQWAPAPGQAAVFYDDDTVVGGGVIEP